MTGAPAPNVDLRQRVLYLERRLKAVERRFEMERLDHVREHRQNYIAITVDYGDYPDQCGEGTPIFPIKFLDATFTKAAGWQDLIQQQRLEASEPDTYAANLSGEWVPAGTLLTSLWQRATYDIAPNDDDGEWFFVHSHGEFWAQAELLTELCDTESGIEVENAVLLPSGEDVDLTGAEISNPRNHRGKVGYNVLMVKRKSGAGSGSGSGGGGGGSGSGACGEWEIVDVYLKPVCQVHRIEDSAACVKYVTLRTAAEWSSGDEPNAWCQLFPWTDCPTDGSGSGSGEADPVCDLSFSFDASWCCSVVGCEGSGSGSGGQQQGGQ